MALSAVAFSGATPTVGDPCVCNAAVGATGVGTDGSVWVRTVASNPCLASDWKTTTWDCSFLNACSINSLIDVDTVTVAPPIDSILYWNGVNWIPGLFCSFLPDCSIDRLGDVDTTTIPPGIGSILNWDGTNWSPNSTCDLLKFCTIDQLADVDTTTVAPPIDSILYWNGANWVPGLFCSFLPDCSIDRLGDVDTTTTAPSVGSVLAWNGANWVPSASSAFSCASLNTCSINSLLDVDTTTTAPENFDVLRWNGVNWIPDDVPCPLTVSYNQNLTSTNPLRLDFNVATCTINVPPPVTGLMVAFGGQTALPGGNVFVPIIGITTTAQNDTSGATMIDAGASRIVVPKTGVYNLTGSIGAQAGLFQNVCPGAELYMSFEINGVMSGRYSTTAAVNTQFTTQVLGVLPSFNLNAGDIIRLAAASDCAAAGQAINSGYLGITLIS